MLVVSNDVWSIKSIFCDYLYTVYTYNHGNTYVWWSYILSVEEQTTTSSSIQWSRCTWEFTLLFVPFRQVNHWDFIEALNRHHFRAWLSHYQRACEERFFQSLTSLIRLMTSFQHSTATPWELVEFSKISSADISNVYLYNTDSNQMCDLKKKSGFILSPLMIYAKVLMR